MAEVKLFTAEGSESGKVDLPDSIFDTEINLNCVREVLTQYQVRQRRGTACAKTRGNVRGGGAKPWRQKGTGRARAGSIRSPLWKGGGVTFGPLPRPYDPKVNRKKKQKAITSALTSFARENSLFVVEGIEFSEPKTRKAVELINNLGIEGKVLFIVDKTQPNFYLSCRNLPYVDVVNVENISIYELVNHDSLVMTREALNKMKEYWG